METTILLIFAVVYLGMILGALPFLQLDRTGIALLGAIALIGVGALDLEEALKAVHFPTLILLFAFMVISAQLRLGGFYTWVTHKTGHLPLSPPKLLAALIVIVASLAAVFSNDVVCLAMAPVLIDVCLARRGRQQQQDEYRRTDRQTFRRLPAIDRRGRLAVSRNRIGRLFVGGQMP